MSKENTRYIEEDEIDLRELFKIIAENKKLIIGLTFLITICSIIYVAFKNPTLVYSGNMMIEIGEVKSNNPNQIYLDNSYNLKQIIEKEFNVTINVPKQTSQTLNNIMIINYNNTDKNEIIKTLLTIKDFILSRHKEKVKLYETHIMTKQIGTATINDQPINRPKKKLIVTVSFAAGLILSIFLVFSLNFIKKSKAKL